MEQMENKSSSRAELIRQARDHCNQQLYSPGKTNHLDTYSDRKEEYDPNQQAATIHLSGIHSLILRFICAMVIFLSIFLMQRFDITFEQFSVTTVQSILSSSEKAHSIEEQATSWVEEKVALVFDKK